MTARARPAQLAPLGPAIRARLREVGVLTTEDLVRKGAIATYRELIESSAGRSTPRCYYLFALDAAIDGKRWQQLPAARRQELAALADSGDESPYMSQARRAQ